MRPQSNATDTQNLLRLFDEDTTKLSYTVIKYQNDLNALKEAIIEELKLPTKDSLPLMNGGDPYSASWHNVFQKNVQKIRAVFQGLGISLEQVDGIVVEYSRKVNNVWA